MKKNSQKLAIMLILAIILGGLLIPAFADAASTSAPSMIPVIPKPELLPGPSEQADQQEVQTYFRDRAIPEFIAGFLGTIAGFALIVLVWAGIQFMISAGNEEGIGNAKKTATWAVVGFALSILSYAIVSIINTIAFPEGEYTPDDQPNVIYEDINP